MQKSVISRKNKLRYIACCDKYLNTGYKIHNINGVCDFFSNFYKFYDSYDFWEKLCEKPNTAAGQIASQWQEFRRSAEYETEVSQKGSFYTGEGATPSRIQMVKLLRKALKDSL